MLELRVVFVLKFLGNVRFLLPPTINFPSTLTPISFSLDF